MTTITIFTAHVMVLRAEKIRQNMTCVLELVPPITKGETKIGAQATIRLTGTGPSVV